MEHLSDEQIAILRAKLEAEAADLQGRLATDAQEMVENINPDPGDIEDSAQADAQRFRNKSLLDRDRAQLAEVEAALDRIDARSYGICEETDEPIPFKRLLLEPTTRFTVEAQEAREGEAIEREPPREDPVGY
jgi:DnaK suppressor protein